MNDLPEINYDILPEHVREGMRLYIECGILPGGFLQAVLRNDLVHAFGRADHINQERMIDFVTFLHNEAPMPCWGSEEKMRAWVEHRQTWTAEKILRREG